MSKVKFHLILNQPILGKYFIFKHLKNTVDSYPELGDIDEQDLKDTINIQYYTNYENIPNRLVLGFSIDFSGFIDEDLPLSGQILDLDYYQNLIRELGNTYKSDDKVETITRFEDAFIIEEALLFHKEVFEIEMKIREVLSYILTFNFSAKNTYDWISDFGGMQIANEEMRKKQTYREKVFDFFMENEVFHVVFTQYGYFNSPKKITKIDKINDLISRAANFLEFKNLMENKGITDELNEVHKAFVGELAKNLGPIEKLRNEIMHNREVKEIVTEKFTQKTDYQKAKLNVLTLIDEFWIQEQSFKTSETIEAEAVLSELFESLVDSNGVISFQDLDGDTLEVVDHEELKEKIIEVMEEYLNIDDDIEALLDLKIEELDG